MIEHNLDVIKTADYIIDIGPEGGDKGGTVIAKANAGRGGESRESYTGKIREEISAEDFLNVQMNVVKK